MQPTSKLAFLILLSFCLISYSSQQNLKVDCDNLNYPNQYVTNKLSPTQKIKFDGVLDESAWTEIGWSSDFVDIQGPVKPPPYYQTRMKMRWDDVYLYVGAFLEEPQGWANLTVNNSIIYHDNDFEVFIDPDGCNHYYKELELNALNLDWNLLLVHPYLNGGPAVCNFTVPNQCVESAPGVPYWDIAPYLPSGTSVKGTLNNPTLGTSYWTLEIGIPLRQYVTYNHYSTYPPSVGDYWRIDFSRVEWHITVHQTESGAVYWKDTSLPEENWVWQATYANPPNMHLPETWGYLQFADDRINATQPVRDTQWPVRDALMQMYYALTLYKQNNKVYTRDLSVLVKDAMLPDYVAVGQCSGVPVVLLTEDDGFVVMSEKNGWRGFVRDDRYLWFNPRQKY